ncbi:MAG TPA: hypothetical protein VD902_16755 [Symbiobacteriaceae bacterium]|nr:hypothetical protein [Symbiobacteriaceae bacterium]
MLLTLKRLAVALAAAALLAGCTAAQPKASETPVAEQPAQPAQPEPKPGEMPPDHPVTEEESEVPPKPRNTDAEKSMAEAAKKAAGGVALDPDIVAVDPMATAILTIGGESTADRAAYRARVMDTARAVANAAMKSAGITKVHITVLTDGTHGTPKDEFALTLFFQEDAMKLSGSWGNLISTDQMLLEAPHQTIHKDLN